MSGTGATGHALLAERVRQAIDAVAETLDAEAYDWGVGARDLRRVVTTGLGSSGAHARFLAELLAEPLGLDARFVATGRFLASDGPRQRDALVVFSQGLSANARFALEAPERWKRVVLATAVPPDTADRAKRGTLDALERAGARILRFPGDGEYGTLMRVLGPLAGYAAAGRLARGLAPHPGRDTTAFEISGQRVRERLAAAPAVYRGALGDDAAGRAPCALLVLLASGGYGELLGNLALKIVEGLLRPPPPIHDLLELSHGPYQQLFSGPATFVALTRPDAPREPELLARLASMLRPDRHRLIELPASLATPSCIFEHEALVNELVLDLAARDGLDLSSWPGQESDGPLYRFGPESTPKPPRAGARELEALTWPELERALAAGATTAVIPLGATEQHGPHLPFSTDTRIAGALARRFCERVDEAIALPAFALGCSSEHMGFPGTLSLSPETLVGVLDDLLASLERHGFARAFLFSAHGGNGEPLRRALPDLRRRTRLELVADLDVARLTDFLHELSAAHGVAATASGHHAGELETSILGALDPTSVRAHALVPGLEHRGTDAQALFYPDLRANAANGTVGDPRAADAGRGAGYLDAWAERLVAHYRRACPRVQPK